MIPPIRIPSNCELLPYQQQDIHQMLGWLQNRKAVYNANPMGSGKTIETISCLNTLMPQSILILATAAAVGVWEGEFETWGMGAQTVEIAEGRNYQVSAWCDVLICSYDLCVPLKKENGERHATPIIKQILNRHWDFLVCDEAHNALANSNAFRARFVLGNLYPKVDKAIFLSGSITRNQINQLWPVFRTIAPELIPEHGEFVEKYCYVIKGRYGKRVVGPKSQVAAKELATLCSKNFLLRRPKEEILPDLPEKLEQKIYIRIPQEEEKLLLEAQKDFDVDRLLEEALESQGQRVDPVLATLRVQLGVAKVPQIVNYVEDYFRDTMGESLVLFCFHIDVLDALYELLDRRYFVTKLSGESSKLAKRDAIDKFQRGVTTIFLSTFAMSEAITLTRASTVIFGEMAYSRYQNEQAIDRLHRIGQKSTVNIKFLLADNPIDRKVYSGYKRKSAEHKRMFG